VARHFAILRDIVAADATQTPVPADYALHRRHREVMLMSCGSRAERGDPANILFAFGVPRIVGCLHAHPNAGTVSEQLVEPNRNVRGDRLALAQNVIEMSKRSRRRKMRACIFSLIFAVGPFSESSGQPLHA
jgi:hypothetical protein